MEDGEGEGGWEEIDVADVEVELSLLDEEDWASSSLEM